VRSREIKAGVARLASTSLREGSWETRVSHHLPNDFTKSNESASALTRNQQLNQGNRPHKGEAEDLDARVLLLHAPPLAVNPLTATDEGPESSSNEPNPSSRRPSSTMHCWRFCRLDLVKQPKAQHRYL
jgi:hypothetical protein